MCIYIYIYIYVNTRVVQSWPMMANHRWTIGQSYTFLMAKHKGTTSFRPA